MFNFLSLGGLPFSATPEELQWVTVRTGEGPQDFVNVLLGDFRTYMTELVNERIDNLGDIGGGGSGPSIWPAARTMTLTGTVSGSASFDGSSNFSVLTSIADGALTLAKVSGLQTALDAKLNASTYTAADVLAKLLTVDGSGSGLEADLLDGYSSRDFLNNTNLTGSTNLNSYSMARTAFNASGLTNAPGGSSNFFNYLMSSHQGGNYVSTGFGMGHSGTGELYYGTATGPSGSFLDRTWTWNRVWTEASFNPATKANVSGQVFTGAVRAPSFSADAAAGTNAEYLMRNESGVSQGALYWERSTDLIKLRRMAAGGSGAEGELSMGATSLTYNGQEIYHTGNLNAGTLGYLGVAATQYASGAGADCNTFLAGSKALVHNTNANTPGAGSAFWYIETLMTGTTADNLLQRAWSTSADETYYRRSTAGAWSAWRRMWHSANFDPSSKLDSNANAATASRLQNARTIALTGVATGSASFDGSANVSIATSVTDASLTIAKTSGLQAALDAKLGTGSFGLGSANSGFDWNDLAQVTRFAAGNGNTPLAGSNVMGFRAVLNNANTIAFSLVGRSNRAWIQSIESNTVNPWYEIWTTNNLPSPVAAARRVEAGNGLSGGGDLSADRTISLGMPGTLTGSTTNNVTATSHTHALSANLTAWDGIAAATKANVTDVWSTQAGTLVHRGTQDWSVVDNSIPTGAYQYHNTASSGGFMQNWGAIYHTRRAVGGGETQLMITETGRMAARGRSTGAWSTWLEFIPYSAATWNNVASSIAQRNSNGDLTIRLLRQEYDTVTDSANYVLGQVELGAGTDNYARPMTMAALWSRLAPSAVAGTDVANYATTLMVKNSAIGANQDLNTYVTTGLWHQSANANTSLALNYPVTFAGMLTVAASSDGIFVYQKYEAYNSGITYVRTKYNSTWYPWRQLLDGTGGITVEGSITSSQNFISSSSNVMLAGGGGAIYLRPNGVASVTGQLTISSIGNVTLAGTINSGGPITSNSASGNPYFNANRTGAATNAIYAATTTGGSIYFGQGRQGYFAVGDGVDLSAAGNRIAEFGRSGSSVASNFTVAGVLDTTNDIVISNASEARIDLNCTGTNGRRIRLVSNTTPNTGFYDATNGAWILRFASDNGAVFAAGLSAANVASTGSFTAGNGRFYSSGDAFLLGGGATNSVYIRPQGWTTAAQTVFAASGVVNFPGNIYTPGEFVAQGSNGLRFNSGTYGCILRNDGSNFYMLFTASGDTNGGWNTLRPITVNNATGLVSIGHNLAVTGTGTFSGTVTSPFFQMGSGAAGEVARVGNDAGLWDRDVANAIGIRGVQNANVGYVMFGNDNLALGYNGTNLTYGGTLSLGGSAVVGGTVDFGSQVKQLINLYTTTYGIGIQGNTMYFRTGAGAISNGGFAWHRGGVHHNDPMTPGAGGVMLGKLDGNGVWSGYDFMIFSDRRIKSKIRPLEYRGRLRPVSYTHDLSGKEDFGFIAQDIRRLYPEAVEKSDETKYLRLSMPKLVAVVSHQINTVEDQQVKQDKTIAKLVVSNTKLKQDNKELSQRLRRVESQIKKLLARAA